MKRRLTILTLATLALAAFIGMVSAAAPSPALAGGATQISGVPFSTKQMPATPRAWAPTSPSL
jgi:hypothetical protein